MQQVLLDFIGKYKERVDAGIAQELDTRLVEVREISPELVSIVQAMKELSVGGKRLRAMLTILGYQISRARQASPLQDEDEIIKAGIAMEIFHLGLLIQDDFMDKDELRRGVKTIGARYEDKHVGNFISMLAGDYTFGWAIESLSALTLPSEVVNRAMAVWGKYFTRVGYGQTLDGLEAADDASILKILAIKSGEYTCVMPLLLGATLAGANQELLGRLEQYGMELGWVFQLRDDWLGEYGDSAKTGKPAGEQVKKGKRTFATMYGKDKTETETLVRMSKSHQIVSGLTDLSGDSRMILDSLVEWLGTREN